MHSYEIGRTYYFEGMVWSWIGRVAAVTATDILLEAGAAKVFQEGLRFSEFLRSGPTAESEIEQAPGRTILNRSAISHATEWGLPIPGTI